MARSKIDPRLRAQFKEVAREIISRDRRLNKAGRSQNTIGEIERALVQAFALGQELGDAPYSAPRPEHLGIDWEEVSPRGREVLSGLTYRHDQFEVTNPVGMRCVQIGQQVRWASEYQTGRVSDHTVAAGSVNPLVRGGLLAPSESDEGLLVLTPKGRATCEVYWRRRAEGDRSLPKESIRA
jgi:hypothetical protein